jgi:chemotaxis protein MotB
VSAKAQIIIIKRKGSHGGHHGGAWKVAYADFVTAMMALFIVLWLMNSSKQIQEAVGGYFKDPSGNSKMVGTDKNGTGDNLPLRMQDMARLREQLQTAIRQLNDFDKLKAHIEMTVTAEGLRIELLESETGLFFQSANSNPTDSAREVLKVLAAELGKIPNRISIEGHTDSMPFIAGANYSNWELSTDRANACRRLMQDSGLHPDQVAEVRGFADQSLRNKVDPTDASNRRITLLVKYLVKPHAAAEASSDDPKSAPADTTTNQSASP